MFTTIADLEKLVVTSDLCILVTGETWNSVDIVCHQAFIKFKPTVSVIKNRYIKLTNSTEIIFTHWSKEDQESCGRKITNILRI